MHRGHAHWPASTVGGSACVLETSPAGHDVSVLRGIQGGLFWQTTAGEWRHNTRWDQLTDDERVGLTRWAACTPGQTAHLTDDGYELLFPKETR